MRITQPQLQNPEFRYYLCRENSKLPLERGYLKGNNYPFFHSKITGHKGNVGILGGYANLIILDFDNESYYQSVCHKLPITFTVASGKKKKPHMYFYLKGEMFRYFGIDRYCKDNRIIANLKRIKALNDVKRCMKTLEFQTWLKSQGLSFKRVCDVMADGGKVICPGSAVDRCYYDVVNDKPIAQITREQIESALGVKISERKQKREFKGESKNNPKAVEIAIKALERIGLKRSNERHFNCAYHDSEAGSCLYINPDGSLWCYHCQRFWKDVHSYIDEAIEGGLKI